MKRFILFGCSFIALFIASCLGSKNSEVSTISLAQKENAKALMLEEVPTNDVLEFAERCFVFEHSFPALVYCMTGNPSH